MNEQLTSASVTSTILVFLTFMPTPDEIVTQEPDHRLRVNEASAAVVSIGLGGMLSIVAKSGAPLLVAMLGTAAMIAGYEYLARTTDARIAAHRQEMKNNVRI